MTLVDAPTTLQPKPKRRRRSDTFAAVLREFGVECLPTHVQKKKPRQTHAGGSLRKMHDAHGPDHLRDVLTVVTETEANAGALIGPVVKAVSRLLLAHPDWWGESATTWLDTIDGIDLVALHGAVKKNVAAVQADQAVTALLHIELAAAYGEARPWRRSELIVDQPSERPMRRRYGLSEMMAEALRQAELDGDGRPVRLSGRLHKWTRDGLRQRGLLKGDASQTLTAEGVAVVEELLAVGSG